MNKLKTPSSSTRNEAKPLASAPVDVPTPSASVVTADGAPDRVLSEAQPGVDLSTDEDGPISVLATITATRERLGDLLCSAFEGGSNYWYDIVEFVAPTGKVFEYDKERLYKHIAFPLSDTGGLMITDTHAGPGCLEKPFFLNKEAVAKGLKVLAEKYPYHYQHFMAEDDDAGTGDAFLQCCVFGEIVYG